jgi:hypothetical protein
VGWLRRARLRAAIATSTELQERYALKQVGFVAAMVGALRDRGVTESTASVAAELGTLAFQTCELRASARAHRWWPA